MLRIGLLGASWAAEHAIVQPLRTRGDAVVTAVAARDPQRAEQYARTHGIAAVAADYAALVARDDVDLVYIGLTPSEHMRWTLCALQAGKHVLCEKPFAMNASEAEQMVAEATRRERLLLEAWHYRFHPLMARIEQLVASGVLGRLRSAEATFHAPIPLAPEAFRWQAQLGGGALLDTGGYTIHVLRTVFGQEPSVLQAAATRAHGVDTRTQAELAFADGVRANIDCAMTGEELYTHLLLVGERGRLRVHGFALPQWGCELRLETDGTSVIERNFPGTTYEAQLAHVIDCVAGRVPPRTGGCDAVANMRVIDAIRVAAGP